MDPTNGYRGLRRRSCSMGLLVRTATILLRPSEIPSRNRFWIVRLDGACGREDLPLACHSLLNLRRRIPQTLQVELSVRVCVPRRDALFAPPLPRALAAASQAVVQCSAFPGVSGALGTASASPPSPKFPASPQLPASSTVKRRAAGILSADPEQAGRSHPPLACAFRAARSAPRDCLRTPSRCFPAFRRLHRLALRARRVSRRAACGSRRSTHSPRCAKPTRADRRDFRPACRQIARGASSPSGTHPGAHLPRPRD